MPRMQDKQSHATLLRVCDHTGYDRPDIHILRIRETKGNKEKEKEYLVQNRNNKLSCPPPRRGCGMHSKRTAGKERLENKEKGEKNTINSKLVNRVRLRTLGGITGRSKHKTLHVAVGQQVAVPVAYW